MAHFLDSEIIKSMQTYWPEEFERTSSSKLRTPGDVQYALAYYYFMISERNQNFDFFDNFEENLDTNGDGYFLI